MWAVVTLLAVAGFAAFQIGGRTAPVPSGPALGQTTGAMAGLAFNGAAGAVVAVDVPEAAIQSVVADEETSGGETDEEAELAPLNTVPTDGWLSGMQMRALVSRYFEPEDVNRAIRVAWCESRFNPTSTDLETGGTGLFHHLPEFWPARADAADFSGAEPTDPEANVAAAAYAVYEEGGWAVFNCSP